MIWLGLLFLIARIASICMITALGVVNMLGGIAIIPACVDILIFLRRKSVPVLYGVLFVWLGIGKHFNNRFCRNCAIIPD